MKRIVRIAAGIITALTAIMSTSGEAKASSHFGWGADVGTSIDVSSHDMSTLNLDAYFGYKNSIIDLAGIGAGIHMMVSNSCRAFPVYALLRTSFRPEPSLCFMDLRCGVAFNSLSNDKNQVSVWLNPGIGFNLARGKTFRSFIVVGYIYNGMKSFGDTKIAGGLSMVNFRFGVTF